MATQTSRSSTLPWLWVIETLASFKQVDASILIELVKRTPQISDDLGENAREMVSLRILESLFAHGSANSSADVSSHKRKFDPSECCEDVLRCILNETSASNLKIGGPEMSRWDVDTFVVHKRSRLPKCALQLLEEGIVEGSHPVLASLKENSGLTITDQSGIGVPVDASNSRGVGQRIEKSCAAGQTIAKEGNSISFDFDNRDDHSQDHLPLRNLLPAKRARNTSPAGAVEGTLDENGNVPLLDVAKKLKQDSPCARQATGQQIIVLPGSEKGLSKENVLHKGTEGPASLIETHPGGLAERTSLEGIHSEDGIMKRMGQTGNIDDAIIQNYQQQLSFNDSGVSTSPPKYSQGQNISSAEGKKVSDGAKVPTVAPCDGAKDDIDEQEISSDSDGCHDERIDIAARKHTFLSSQRTYSQDSFATADCSELNLCVKCNTGGNLLVCSANACPLVVHESCLGSSASFDGSGNFYCPFCAYSQAISEYLKVKKKASLSRKDLAAFIGVDVEHRPKRFSRRLRLSRKNQIRQNEDAHETNNVENVVVGSNNDLHGSDTEDKQQSVSAVLGDNDICPSGEKVAAITNGIHRSLTENEYEGKKMDQESRPPSDPGEKQVAAENVPSSGVGTVSSKDIETVNRSETPPAIEQQQGIRSQLAINLPNENVRPFNTIAERASEGENDNRISSNYFRRSRKLDMQYTYPAVPQLRRKKVPWTKEEEEKLKEGVQRFVSAHDSKIPWTKILEFGNDVFAKGRTTIDLKDKWRNINRGSPKLK